MKSIFQSLAYASLVCGAAINHGSSKPQHVPSPHKPYPKNEIAAYRHFTEVHGNHTNDHKLVARNSGRGVTWSPYNTDGCKGQDQVNQEFATIFANEDPSAIRVYGVDCNQIRMAMDGIINNGKRGSALVWAGIYNVDNANNEAGQLADQVNGEWDLIDTVSVGNEGFNDGKYDVNTIRNAVDSVKGQLQGRGWYGRVTTVDVFFQYRDHPDLCSVGDAVAVNIQPYFDGGVAAQDIGGWVRGQMNNVANWCPGRTVVVTEAGWPSCGQQNGQAVASYQNQQDAIQSLRNEFSGYLFMFTAFNDYWKNPGPIGVEQCFGFMS